MHNDKENDLISLCFYDLFAYAYNFHGLYNSFV